MNRKLGIDGAEMAVIATTRDGEMIAVCWGQTSATARPLPIREEIAEVIEVEILDFFDCPGIHLDLPFTADAVLDLLKGQDV